jgi:hypothetical protein
MFRRRARVLVEEALGRQAAVALLGPRQVGKTTLALEIAATRPGTVYLDLESREDRAKLSDPVSFLRGSITFSRSTPRLGSVDRLTSAAPAASHPPRRTKPQGKEQSLANIAHALRRNRSDEGAKAGQRHRGHMMQVGCG